MKEQVVVNLVERELKYLNYYCINNHGTIYSKAGTPDIISILPSGRFLGIEVKAPKQTPRANQYRQAIKIIQNGGIYLIAQEDISVEMIESLNEETSILPKIVVGPSYYNDEFELAELPVEHSSEVVLQQLNVEGD